MLVSWSKMRQAKREDLLSLEQSWFNKSGAIFISRAFKAGLPFSEAANTNTAWSPSRITVISGKERRKKMDSMNTSSASTTSRQVFTATAQAMVLEASRTFSCLLDLSWRNTCFR